MRWDKITWTVLSPLWQEGTLKDDWMKREGITNWGDGQEWDETPGETKPSCIFRSISPPCNPLCVFHQVMLTALMSRTCLTTSVRSPTTSCEWMLTPVQGQKNHSIPQYTSTQDREVERQEDMRGRGQVAEGIMNFWNLVTVYQRQFKSRWLKEKCCQVEKKKRKAHIIQNVDYFTFFNHLKWLHSKVEMITAVQKNIKAPH